MTLSSVYYSSRHLNYLLNQRNVLCLNRNHLFRSIRLRFAHNALPTQRNLPNWLVGGQLMEAIKSKSSESSDRMGLDPMCWTRSIPGMSWGKRDDPTRWQE